MNWSLVRQHGVRYTVGAAGLVAGVVVGVAASREAVSSAALGLVVVGGLAILVSVVSPGASSGSTAVEPASGVHIDPRDGDEAPAGSGPLRSFFVGVGLVVWGSLSLVVFGL